MALALGWTLIGDKSDLGRPPTHGFAHGPDAAWTFIPAFKTDIRATIAEIERRGWWWSKTNMTQRDYMAVSTGAGRHEALTDGTLAGDTTALLLALIRAVQP